MNTFFKKSSLLHTITAVGMAATAIVYALAKAKEALGDKLPANVVKEIYVPGKIINIVGK